MSADNWYYLGLIPLFPLIGAIINGLIGWKFPRWLNAVIACTGIGLSLLCGMISLKVLLNLPAGVRALHFTAYEWFQTGPIAKHAAPFTVDIAFTMDALSAVMVLVVTGVGFLIHVYSAGYMAHDRSPARFFAYLNLFTFAMLVLVLGSNLVVMFVGWEGVGLCSYLLIGFWYEDYEKATHGKKAFIVNRVGDFAFLIGMFLVVKSVGSLDIATIREYTLHLDPSLVGIFTAAGLLMFIGCTGKSAQIPLYTWLPDAMSGPTPVSALIHAATMVTAGVYLVSRMNFLFVISPAVMITIGVVGVLTALFAATIGLAQNDIKKVLAYSTVSQLGYMFLACGVGAWWAAIFHLMTHAFFKALLFLGSGSVIHGMDGEQDIRKMGGLRKYMPVTHWTFLIACCAIAGVPLLSAFFSKDAILWHAFANEMVYEFQGANNEMALATVWRGYHYMVWGVGLLTAGLTAFYMFRLYFLTFTGKCRASEETKKKIHESPPSMTVPLMILAVLAVVGGWIGMPHVFHVPNLFEHWLHPLFYNVEIAGAIKQHEVIWEWGLMLASVAVGLTGIGLAWHMYVRQPDLPKKIVERVNFAYRAVLNKYWVDELYDLLFVRPLLRVSDFFCYRIVDALIIDKIMVDGSALSVATFGRFLRRLQNGNVQRYVTFIVIGLGLMLLFIWIQT